MDRDEADRSTRDIDGDARERSEAEEKRKSQRTLDSDEELEEEKNPDRLDVMRKVEGQEEGTLDFEGNVKIMPFNMKEDLEDGHFDTTGSFVWSKNKEEVKDAWLDNIDWAKIKKDAGDQWQQEQEDEDRPNDFTSAERRRVYEQLAAILRPGESVAAALRRLGRDETEAKAGNKADSKSSSAGKPKLSAAAEERQRRWAAKKEAAAKAKGTTSAEGVDATATNDDDKNGDAGTSATTSSSVALGQVAKLTELVDSLVSNGEFDTYQYTLERVRVRITEMDKEEKRQNVAADKDLDMFGDDSAAAVSTAAVTNSATTPNAESSSLDQPLKWEYKMSQDEGAKIHGPVDTDEMIRLQNEGRFDDGCWARKCDGSSGPGDGQFYSVKRIDFELYI